MTAAEHETWLKATGQYDAMVERQRQQEDERQKRVAELRRAEKPFIEDLQRIGVIVQTTWDLIGRKELDEPELVPLLIKHLGRSYPVAVREGIARALARPIACKHWNALIDLFRSEQEERIKDALGATLMALVRQDTIDDLIALLRDKRNGSSRVFFIRPVAKLKRVEAEALMLEFSKDPELSIEVADVLKARAKRQRNKI
jgi:HEAT repeat protein